MYYFIRSILFLCPPERAHHLSLALFKRLTSIPLLKRFVRWLSKPKMHRVELFGLKFDSPIGLAAGFDKNGEHTEIIESLGFGFIEIGSVTYRPWVGNPQPRLFRLPRDGAIINRMGLNNQGADAVARRLKSLNLSIPLFINIAKTPDKSMSEADTVQDYCKSVERLKPFADVMVLNISCPNADGGKTFEDPMLLTQLLTGVRGVLDETEKPLLIKLSPDLSVEQLEQTMTVCERFNVSGYTATNTTTTRQDLNTSDEDLHAIGKGGLSGMPLHSRAVQTVRHIRSFTHKPIIGVGGIFDGESAQDFLSAGASLVQIYSGFIYGGPMIVKNISKGIRD
jgi:dihydroorotate dehydrogenase